MFSTIASSSTSPPPPSDPQIIALHVLPDTRQICVITRSGDLTTVSLEDEAPIVSPFIPWIFNSLTVCISQPEVEGTIESGILAASWSPDEELIVLVTGERKLILMTPTFDVLSEEFLETQDFGEGTFDRRLVPQIYKLTFLQTRP